jgi:hypothetical protein
MSTSLRVLALLAAVAAARSAVAQTGQPEPPPLRLPPGVRVRVSTRQLPVYRVDEIINSAGREAAHTRGTLARSVEIRGHLVRAEAGSVTIVPESNDLFAPGEMTFAAEEVERVELSFHRRNHWLKGLLIGAALGVALGLRDDVDPVLCEQNENVMCNRAESLAYTGAGFAALGLGIGALVKTDTWTPVALDALEGRAARESRGAAPLGLHFTVRF